MERSRREQSEQGDKEQVADRPDPDIVKSSARSYIDKEIERSGVL